jgi:membrane-bound lytic murein transglycosylase B
MDEERVLERMAGGLKKANVPQLRALGSELAEESFLTGSPRLVELAAVSYSLGKFLEKHYITGSKRWKAFEKQSGERLAEAAKAVRAGREEDAERAIDSVVEDITEFSESMGRFQVDVVTKARVKIATDAYAHGASLGRACALAGVNKALVLNYIGVTTLSDKYETLSVRERLASARKVFG